MELAAAGACGPCWTAARPRQQSAAPYSTRQVPWLLGVAAGVGAARPLRPRHLQRRRAPAQGGVVRYARVRGRAADKGANGEAASLAVSQAEHRPKREGRRIDAAVQGLPAPARAWFGLGFDRLVAEPDRQAAALPQARVVAGQSVTLCFVLPWWLLSGFGVVSIGLRDQGGDELPRSALPRRRALCTNWKKPR